jgi:hypothetical protein
MPNVAWAQKLSGGIRQTVAFFVQAKATHSVFDNGADDTGYYVAGRARLDDTLVTRPSAGQQQQRVWSPRTSYSELVAAPGEPALPAFDTFQYLLCMRDDRSVQWALVFVTGFARSIDLSAMTQSTHEDAIYLSLHSPNDGNALDGVFLAQFANATSARPTSLERVVLDTATLQPSPTYGWSSLFRLRRTTGSVVWWRNSAIARSSGTDGESLVLDSATNALYVLHRFGAEHTVQLFNDANYTVTCAGDEDVTLVKLDAATARIEWARQWAGPLKDQGGDITFSAATGFVYVVVTTSHPSADLLDARTGALLDSYVTTEPQGSGLRVLAFDAAGTQQWRYFPYSGSAFFHFGIAIVADVAGALYVSTSDPQVRVEAGADSFQRSIFKLDGATGALEWQRGFPGNLFGQNPIALALNAAGEPHFAIEYEAMFKMSLEDRHGTSVMPPGLVVPPHECFGSTIYAGKLYANGSLAYLVSVGGPGADNLPDQYVVHRMTVNPRSGDLVMHVSFELRARYGSENFTSDGERDTVLFALPGASTTLPEPLAQSVNASEDVALLVTLGATLPAELAGRTQRMRIDVLPLRGGVLRQYSGGVGGDCSAAALGAVISTGDFVTDALHRVCYKGAANACAESDRFEFRALVGTEPTHVSARLGAVTVHVACVNDAPVVRNGTLVLFEDFSAIFALTAVDVEAGQLRFEILSVPSATRVGVLRRSSGAVISTVPLLLDDNIGAAGGESSVLFVPAQDVFGTRLGLFSFRCIDADGAVSNVAWVSISVNPANDAPALPQQSIDVALEQDDLLIVALPSSDVDGDTLSCFVDAVTAPTLAALAASDIRLYTSAVNVSTPACAQLLATVQGNNASSSSSSSSSDSCVYDTASPCRFGAARDAAQFNAVFAACALQRFNASTQHAVLLPPNHRLAVHVAGRDASAAFELSGLSYPCEDAASLSSASAELRLSWFVTNVFGVNQSVALSEDTSVTITLASLNVPAQLAWQAVITAVPQHGMLFQLVGAGAAAVPGNSIGVAEIAVTNAQHRLRYVPETHTHGRDSFSFRVEVPTTGVRSLADAEARAYLDVAPVNDAPVVTQAELSVPISNNDDVLVAFPVQDADASSGDVLTATLETLPRKGQLFQVSVNAVNSLVTRGERIAATGVAIPAVQATGIPAVIYAPNEQGGGYPHVATFRASFRDAAGAPSALDATVHIDAACAETLFNRVWSQRDGAVCSECLPGALCSNTGEFLPVAQPGFWRELQLTSDTGAAAAAAAAASGADPVASLQFIPCVPAEACLAGASANRSAAQSCAAGYSALFCGTCSSGFYRLNDECRPCETTRKWTLILAIGVPCVLLAVLLVLWIAVRRPDLALFKVFGFFVQCLAVFASFRLQWTGPVKTLLDTLSSANMNVELLQLECEQGGVDYEVKWFATMLAPFVLLVLMLVAVPIYAAVRACVKCRQAGGDAHDDVVEVSCGCCCIAKKRCCTGSELMYSVFTLFVRIMLFAYLFLCIKAYEVFDCTELANGQLLFDADPSLFCKDPWWHRMVPYAAVAVVLLTFGFPLLIGYWVWRVRPTHAASSDGSGSGCCGYFGFVCCRLPCQCLSPRRCFCGDPHQTRRPGKMAATSNASAASAVTAAAAASDDTDAVLRRRFQFLTGNFRPETYYYVRYFAFMLHWHYNLLVLVL